MHSFESIPSHSIPFYLWNIQENTQGSSLNTKNENCLMLASSTAKAPKSLIVLLRSCNYGLGCFNNNSLILKTSSLSTISVSLEAWSQTQCLRIKSYLSFLSSQRA